MSSCCAGNAQYCRVSPSLAQELSLLYALSCDFGVLRRSTSVDAYFSAEAEKPLAKWKLLLNNIDVQSRRIAETFHLARKLLLQEPNVRSQLLGDPEDVTKKNEARLFINTELSPGFSSKMRFSKTTRNCYVRTSNCLGFSVFDIWKVVWNRCAMQRNQILSSAVEKNPASENKLFLHESLQSWSSSLSTIIIITTIVTVFTTIIIFAKQLVIFEAVFKYSLHRWLLEDFLCFSPQNSSLFVSVYK